MVESRKLRLSDKVFGKGGILGDRFKTPSDNKAIDEITVEHLLHHSAGFTNNGGDPMWKNYDQSHDKLIKAVLNDDDKIVKKSDIGKVSSYNNFGYCLLGRVIEEKSGKSYENYVRSAVFKKASVSEAYVARNKASEARPREVHYYPESSYDVNVRRFDSHGGWAISPIDLLRFLVRYDGKPTKSDLIASTLHTDMITPPNGVVDTSGNPTNYARGWAQPGNKRSQWHNGSIPGALAALAVYDGDIEYAIVTNQRTSADTSAVQLERAFRAAIDSVKKWPSRDMF